MKPVKDFRKVRLEARYRVCTYFMVFQGRLPLLLLRRIDWRKIRGVAFGRPTKTRWWRPLAASTFLSHFSAVDSVKQTENSESRLIEVNQEKEF